MGALALGTVLGFLSGLGIGGGSLLLLWLTAVTGTDPETARTINLLFFLPAALISTWLRRNEALAPPPIIGAAMLGGAAGAMLGSMLCAVLGESPILRKGMGIVFLISGIRELRYRRRELR